ncbi:hypothetical protein ACFLTN_06255 [Chloroflexota bacterium]
MMPESKKKYLQTYISRVNRVIDYIEENIDKDLSLEGLAEVAQFPPLLLSSNIQRYGG